MPAIDLDAMEADLNRSSDLLGRDPLGPLKRTRPEDFAQPAVRRGPLPDYVKHAEGMSQIGALSAEAVVKQYEAAASEIESMGKELLKLVDFCESVKGDAMKAMAEAQETAQGYRDEAKKKFEEIEQQSLLTQEVVRTCSIIKEKIGAAA